MHYRFFALALLVLLLACGGGAAATPRPTEPPAATATAAPTLPPPPTAVPAYASGGLGLARADWEALYGAPTREAGGVYFYGTKGLLSVMYLGDIVWHIEVSYPGTAGLVAVREEVQKLLPTGAELADTYTTDIGQLVDLYHDASLADRFPDEVWVGGKPGDHVVVYRRDETTKRVSGIVIGTGNNP